MTRPTQAKASRAEATQEPSLQAGRVSRGEIAKITNSTGTVRPDITVQVGSEVSGKLLTVEVDFNSVVKKSDILATIDPENLENRVSQAGAVLENRKLDININEASLRRADVNAEYLTTNVGGMSPGPNDKTESRNNLYELNAITSVPVAYLEAEFHDWNIGVEFLWTNERWHWAIASAVDRQLGYPR